jgi:hypothetical protein
LYCNREDISECKVVVDIVESSAAAVKEYKDGLHTAVIGVLLSVAEVKAKVAAVAVTLVMLTTFLRLGEE